MASPTQQVHKNLACCRTGPEEFDLWVMSRGNYKKLDPPRNVTIRKGSKNVALTRQFTDTVLKEKFAWELYEWLSDTVVPDEHFYSTLAAIKEIT